MIAGVSPYVALFCQFVALVFLLSSEGLNPYRLVNTFVKLLIDSNPVSQATSPTLLSVVSSNFFAFCNLNCLI